MDVSADRRVPDRVGRSKSASIGVERRFRSDDTTGAPVSRTRSLLAAARFPLILATHLFLIALASYLALWLRFDGAIPAPVLATYVQLLPWVLLIRGLAFVPFGLYGGIWRYTSIWDLCRIVLAVAISSVVLYLVLYSPLGAEGYPRSIVIIDSVLLISFLGGVRLLWRLFPAAIRSTTRGHPVLIIGAGDAGEMIVREMQRSGTYWPVGFIDDDPVKAGRTIHGVKVLGTRNDLANIVKATQPSEVLIAIPSAKKEAVRSFVQMLETFKLPITTLPGLEELVNGRVAIKQIRPLSIADLLPRSQVTLDAAAARQLIGGKRVLVTGAGGSIGSELCRQIAAFEPASLVLFERYENGLYAIANDLADRGTSVTVCPTVGDVTDAARVHGVFAQYRPQIVFHAAAHKHVPLMEHNPCEAVKNNVVGTQVVAEAARQYRAERFVLISTDKAANPSSVMGATKRVAELIVQSVTGDRSTRFVTVRFGNVLGSNGSVIPRMIDQIRAGGPVTVTHQEIRRYFMLIPEAVQLVLQAAVVAGDRETLVLDMGEQIKIVDLARNLIRLSGFVPDDEIKITFVGLRPGEKLSEELVGEGEELEPGGADKIFRVRWPATPASAGLPDMIRALVRAATGGHSEQVVALLSSIVPTFTQQPIPAVSDVQVSNTTPAATPATTPAAATASPVRRLQGRGTLPAGPASRVAVPSSKPQT